jgi:hypothetical protein
MPTNRTKRSRSKQGLDYWKIDQLVTGSFLLAGVGYAAVCHDGWNHWSEEDERRVHELMRTDWDQLGADFMAWWRVENDRFTAAYATYGDKRRDPSITPWALTKFGEPQ